MLLTDHIALDSRGAKKTREGFLVDEPRIARTGIQTYTAGELGLKDRAASDVIRVYRPEAEVFATDALRSFSAIDLTIDHPKGMVDAKNWRDLAVGNTGEGVLRDGEFLRCPIIVKDQRAIDAIDAGKAELSVGYTCDLAFEAGETPSGEAYDAVQKNIRANHLALCDRARGGSLLRIGDSKGDTPVKTLVIDGLQVPNVGPEAEAAIVKLQGQVNDAVKAKEAAEAQVATLTTDAATKDAEIATLKKQVEDAKITPAQLRDAAKAYATTKAQAKALAPDLTIGDDMDEPAIKKAVVNAKLGDAAKGWSDQQVEVSFATMAAGVKLDDAKDEADPLRQALGDHQPTTDADKAVKDAREKMLADLRAGNVTQAAA